MTFENIVAKGEILLMMSNFSFGNNIFKLSLYLTIKLSFMDIFQVFVTVFSCCRFVVCGKGLRSLKVLSNFYLARLMNESIISLELESNLLFEK